MQTRAMPHEGHVWFGATAAQKIFPRLLRLHVVHFTALAIIAFYVHVFPLEKDEI